MSTAIGIGVSNKLDSFLAGKEAAFSSFRQLSGNCNLFLVFSSTIFDQKEMLRGIKSVSQNSPIIGCSSPAQISTQGLTKDSVTVVTFRSDTIKFTMGVGERISQNPRAAGQKAAREALKSGPAQRQLFIIFPDGLTGNISEVIRGAQEVLGTSFPIVGGSAGDELRFQNSFQYFNNSLYQDSVPGILIGGDIKFAITVKHSWFPIGKPHKVTKSKQNIIKELDHRPAIEIYGDYFEKTLDEFGNGELARISVLYPLGVTLKSEDRYLIRAPIKVGEYGALVLPGDVTEGAEVQLMIGDKSIVLESAKEAAQDALKKIKSPFNIRLVLIFSSAARLKLLGRDAKQEIDIIRNVLGNNLPIIGFYTYGEEVPLLAEAYKGQSLFQSHTIMVVTIGE